MAQDQAPELGRHDTARVAFDQFATHCGLKPGDTARHRRLAVPQPC